jgi:uncharacterized protein (DUF58 family)
MQRFGPFLLILFLIAVVLRLNMFFAVLYLFLALALMSYFWMGRREERVYAARRFVDRAFFGDRVRVDLTVHNSSWLPIPWLQLHESLPIDLFSPPMKGRVVSLRPRERWHTSYTLSCRRRGYYSIGPLTMTTGDMLGLVRNSTLEVAPDFLIVYPKVVPLHRLGLPTHSPLVVLPARSPLFEDPSRVTGVRDYQRGDSPRRIHWTATASTGRLLVKQYQPAIARETLICLDLDEENYERRQRFTATELAIVVAASIAHHIIVQEGLPAGLATEALDSVTDEQVRFFLPPRSERTQLMRTLETLARAQTVKETSFPDLLRRASVRLAWGATLLVVTGSESTALFDTLVHLQRAGYAVALMLVQPAYPADDLRKRAELVSLPVHRVWRERDLEMWG